VKRLAVLLGLAVVALGLLGVSSAATHQRPGTPDPSFGTRGRVITAFGSNNVVAEAVAVQRDGKLVVGGRVLNSLDGDPAVALARYTRRGSLDPSFGKGGRVQEPNVSGYRSLTAIALTRGGKIVATGVSGASAGGPFRLVLARYMPNGSLDPSFGQGGKVFQQVDTETIGLSVAVLPSGRIYVAGESSHSGGIWDAFVERFAPNGNLDPAFGARGLVRVPSISPYYGEPLLVRADGNVLVGGADQTGRGFALARFNPDGSVDQSFGYAYSGTVDTNFGSETDLTRLAIQPSGKIIAAGYSDSTTRGLTSHSPGTAAPANSIVDLVASAPRGRSSFRLGRGRWPAISKRQGWRFSETAKLSSAGRSLARRRSGLH
jgi:uncharacterized delta-60 repeat protein